MSQLLTPEEEYLRFLRDGCNPSVLQALYHVMSCDARARMFLWYAEERCSRALDSMLLIGESTELYVENQRGEDACMLTIFNLCVEECVQGCKNPQHHGEGVRVWNVLQKHHGNRDVLLPNRVVGCGWTSFLKACSYPAYDTVEMLYRGGANPNIAGIGGWTALMQATAHNDPMLVEMLLSWGADPAMRDCRGKTARAYAEEQRLWDVVYCIPKHV